MNMKNDRQLSLFIIHATFRFNLYIYMVNKIQNNQILE